MEEVTSVLSLGGWIGFQQLMIGGKGMIGGRNGLSETREAGQQDMLRHASGLFRVVGCVGGDMEGEQWMVAVGQREARLCEGTNLE